MESNHADSPFNETGYATDAVKLHANGNSPTQEPLIPEETNEEKHRRTILDLETGKIPPEFEFKLSLVLKSTSENTLPHSIPIAQGTAFSESVEELLTKSFASKYFLQRLRAVVGEPRQEGEKQISLPSDDEQL